MMMKTAATRRLGCRQYVSCLAGRSPLPPTPNTKRSAPPRVALLPHEHYPRGVSSSRSERSNLQKITAPSSSSWENSSVLYNYFNNSNNPSQQRQQQQQQQVLARKPYHYHQNENIHPTRWSSQLQQRFFFSSTPVSSSTTHTTLKSSIENTPLDGPEGAALLKGLNVHTVHAEDDGHPLAVYTVEDDNDDDDDDETEQQLKKQQQPRTPVLLLHGRTWSSTTVYHLTGGVDVDIDVNVDADEHNDDNNRSLLRALRDTHHIQPYAMDFRGFGGTPKDESGFVEPLRCVEDVVSVLNWMHERHRHGGQTNDDGDGDDDSTDDDSTRPRPALLGWSHGALIAQITAQRHEEALSKLILYGSTYNPNMRYPIPSPSETTNNIHNRNNNNNNKNKSSSSHNNKQKKEGLYAELHYDFPLHEMAARNEYGGAMEDFTNTGCPAISKLFAEAAMISDPIKVQWWNLHQLNECHPSLVKVPTMVIAGDQDPYAPMQIQAELFTHLGRGVDRIWSIIANADHAVHLSEERHRFVENLDNFLETRE